MKQVSEPTDTVIMGEAPVSGRRRMWTFLVFIALSLIVGFSAKKYHRHHLKLAVFAVPISTGITHDVTKDSYTIDYRASTVAGRACLDIGGLRVVAPGNERRNSTSSGSIGLSKNSSGSSSGGSGRWNVEMERAGFEMNVRFGTIHFEINRTIATIDGTNFDIAKGKTVVVIGHSGRVEEMREIEAGP
jgi:hypothetical protein